MHLLSFHRRIVSAGLLLMVIDWIFENCYKTMVVERALQGDFNDYDAKQRILRQAEAGQLVPVGEVGRNEQTQ